MRTVAVIGAGPSGLVTAKHGLEIATDLAAHTRVVSALRRPQYVIEKVVDGVPSDFGARSHRPRSMPTTRSG